MKRDLDGPRFDVLAIGELNADIIFTGLKGPPVLNREIGAGDFRKTMGSSTALCAANLARLGLAAAFCGKVGGDEDGRFMLEELRKRNIDAGFCTVDPAAKTGVTLALNWGGDRALVTFPGVMSGFSLGDFDINILRQARHVHAGSFFLQFGLQKDLPEIFRRAREWGISTSLDAGWDDTEQWDYGIRSVLPYTDIFLPNESEALAITGESSWEAAAEKLSGLCTAAVVKRGKNGAGCVSRGNLLEVRGIEDAPVLDTTGAGDSFNAGFIYGYLNKFSLRECLEYGNACGALCVSAAGGADADLRPWKVREMVRHGEKFQ
ncbi:MAG: sugar kinase [Treponema sp.]|jgi:sugar/nucleoside kinase (ribokinase family)|nr:sugar kinase [Treponema sp.]